MTTQNVQNIAAEVLNARLHPVIDPTIISLFKECTPKILVVTDSFLDFSVNDFGLSDFINTLKTSTIHGMTPIVKTAHRGGAAADYPGFVFTSTTLSKSQYDVLFLFGTEDAGSLPATEVAVIEKFMDDGGGVFGTGDHLYLGRELCGSVKRLKDMRRWNGPSASTNQRLSTNDPGTNNSFEFIDQSDAIPQKIYPAYDTTTNLPHFLLQHPTKNIIEVLPDHPHESECLVPVSVSSSDWPKDSSGGDVAPELVALSMSYGGGFPGKSPIDVPRSFGAIGAYDGHETDDCVGRIVVDATWHHFINVNIIASTDGLGLVPNADAYDRVSTYFRNIADWLMPKKLRYCLRWPILILAKQLYPIAEFLPHNKKQSLELDMAIELGRELRSTLSRLMTPAQIKQLEDDLIETGNTRLKYRLKKLKESNELHNLVAKDFATEDLYRLSSLGAAIYTAATLLPNGHELESTFQKIDGEKGLNAYCKENIDHCFKLLNNELSKGRAALDELLEGLD